MGKKIGVKYCVEFPIHKMCIYIIWEIYGFTFREIVSQKDAVANANRFLREIVSQNQFILLLL